MVSPSNIKFDVYAHDYNTEGSASRLLIAALLLILFFLVLNLGASAPASASPASARIVIMLTQTPWSGDGASTGDTLTVVGYWMPVPAVESCLNGQSVCCVVVDHPPVNAPIPTYSIPNCAQVAQALDEGVNLADLTLQPSGALERGGD